MLPADGPDQDAATTHGLTETFAVRHGDSHLVGIGKESGLAWEEIIRDTEVLQAVYGEGFSTPSQIQWQAIPVLTRDPPQSLLAQSPSGSGKTLAFVISMFLRIDPRVRKLQAICLAGTPELVDQIVMVCEDLNHLSQFSLGWTVGNEFHGEPDVQILIGTGPGVVMAITESRNGRPPLDVSSVSILILNEAGELVENPSPPRKGEAPKPALFATIDRLINKCLPRNISIGFFSACYSDDAVRAIKRWRPELLEVRNREVQKEIRHFSYIVRDPEVDSVTLLRQITREHFISQGIIFLSSQDQPERVAERLMQCGIDCRWFMDEMDPQERVRLLTEFRENQFKFLATTNMYTRLIGNQEVFLVIQVGISRHTRDKLVANVMDYGRRAAQAGRLGCVGVSVSCITEEEVVLLGDIEKELEIHINPQTAEIPWELPDVAS
jgi:ATP-dependent RNA helicase DDX19/DBP5